MTTKARTTTKPTKTPVGRPARKAAKPPTKQAAVTRARTASEDRLWKALVANPNNTAAQLTSAANIGKSTAGKILATWATDGTVTRTPGPAVRGRRAADLWAINPSDTAPTTADAESTDTQPNEAVSAAATPTGSAGNGKAPRLASGALRGMVEDFLTAHPGEKLSPNSIAKALDRSGGAVNNALEKLVADGYATKSHDAPKRFTLTTTG